MIWKLYMTGVLAALFECDSECVDVTDTEGWVTPAPADPSLEELVGSWLSESQLIACGLKISRDRWDYNGITGLQTRYCDAIDQSLTENAQTDGFSEEGAEELKCDSGYFIDGLRAKFQE